tara:strand:- start:136 stop:1209 length:1074 start_codon:yes stop_codon:yes gene_type:complete
MEKNNNKQANTKEATPQVDAELLEEQPVERSKFILIWVAIVILLGLIAASFWYLQQQLYTQQQLEPVALTQDSSLTEQLESQITQLKQAVNAEAATTEQRLVGLDAENLTLLDKVDELAKTQKLTNDDVLRSWTLAELKFLLQSANQSVLLAGNVDKAQAALTLADQQLKSLTDPRLHELRGLIADDKLALASVAKVDIDGLALQLQSALNKVDDLQVLMGPELGNQADDHSVADSSLSSTWKMALSQAWQEMKSLVVIRHQQDAAIAVLVPEQRYFLYQNLRLKLESARLGLLSARETVFHDNLASAEQWLQQYFIGTERDAMLEMLKAMQSETIAVDMPDISASLIWLQQYGDQQ